MSNPIPLNQLLRTPLYDPKTGIVHPDWQRWFTYKVQQIDPALNLQGQVQATTKISGRTEPVGTTVTNLQSDGTFNSLDNVHNGTSYQRQPVFAGTAITVENGNFETSANLPPEGWTIQGNPVLSYETVAPQGGLRSLIVTPSGIFDGVLSTRKFSCNPGDAFRVSGWVFQSFAGDASVQLNFYDKTGTFIGQIVATAATTGAWTFIFATGIAPANTVYLRLGAVQQNAATRPVKFDSINASRLQTAFELTPINTAGTPTATTGLCTQHSAGGTRIDVASSTWQFGDGQVTYNSGFVDPGSLGTWYIYADDPAYSGGAVTYVATATPANANAADGRLFFGKITTAGGTATSTGGGSGGGGPISKASLV